MAPHGCGASRPPKHRTFAIDRLAGATLAFEGKGEGTLLVWSSDKEHVEADYFLVEDLVRRTAS